MIIREPSNQYDAGDDKVRDGFSVSVSASTTSTTATSFPTTGGFDTTF